MSFFSRLKNIIRSNINSGTDKIGKTDDINLSDTVINTKSVNDFQEEKNQPDYTESQYSQDAEYYAVLEVEYGADFEKIRQAYKKLLKKYHPDLYHNQPEKIKTAEKLVEKINAAYSYFEQKNK